MLTKKDVEEQLDRLKKVMDEVEPYIHLAREYGIKLGREHSHLAGRLFPVDRSIPFDHNGMRLGDGSIAAAGNLAWSLSPESVLATEPKPAKLWRMTNWKIEDGEIIREEVEIEPTEGISPPLSAVTPRDRVPTEEECKRDGGYNPAIVGEGREFSELPMQALGALGVPGSIEESWKEWENPLVTR